MKKIMNHFIICLLVSLFMLTLFLSNCFYIKRVSSAVAAEVSTNILDRKIIADVDITDDFVDNRVIVVLNKEISNPMGISEEVTNNLFKDVDYVDIQDISKIKLNDKIGAYYNNKTFRQILKVELEENSKDNVIDTIRELEENDDILYVGPDYISSVSSLYPTDPYYSSQWGLHGTYGIDVEDAWDVTTGSNEVTVGIIDTGIALHEDLFSNISAGYDFYNQNAYAIDDVAGHGTHVAGIICANSNYVGGVGVSPGVKISPLQIFGVNTVSNKIESTMSETIEAITFATGLWGTPYQISILNYSVSGFGQDISLAYSISQFPGLFVCAAGNGEYEESINQTIGLNVDDYDYIDYFDLPNLISVGAIDRFGDKADFSNYGYNVDIYAPGVEIYSTIPGDDYESKNGTSMAASFVSGVAALLLSENMGLTASELKASIINGAEDIEILGNDGYIYDSYRLSAAGAMRYAQSTFEDIPAPLRLSVNEKNGNVWTIRLRNPNNFTVYAAYNSRMCFYSDAKTFSNLNDIVEIEIPARSFEDVLIEENGTAGWITASIGYSTGIYNHCRLISCAHGLTVGSSTFNYYIEHYTKTIRSFAEVSSEPDYLTFSISSGAVLGRWTVTIHNSNDYSVGLEYNSKLCFIEDARYFANLSDVLGATINANSSTVVHIDSNWFADYITARINYYYHGFAYTKVTYAKAEIPVSCQTTKIRYI